MIRLDIFKFPNIPPLPALLSLLALIALLFSACGKAAGEGVSSGGSIPAGQPSGTYTYRDAVSQLCTNWNPHTYETTSDSYPLDFTTSSLYSIVFNDALHPVEGKEAYAAYAIVPEMAAGEPEDVTGEVREAHPVFGIPRSAKKGFAYRVPLRQDLCWDDGTPITAQTFVDSLQRLLDPSLLNYRASDVYKGTYAIANAEAYANAGVGQFVSFADLGTDYDRYIAEGHGDAEVYVDLSGFWNITTETGLSYGAITDDGQIRDPAVAEGEEEDYVSPKYLWENYLHSGPIDPETAAQFTGIVEQNYAENYPFENVGLYAEGDYALVFVFKNALEGYYLNVGLNSFWLVKPDLYDRCLKETVTASGSVWSSSYCTSAATAVSYGPYKIRDYQADKSLYLERNERWFGYQDGAHVYADPVDGGTYDMYQSTAIDCQVVAENATTRQMFFAGKLMEYGLQAEDFDQYRNSEFCYQTPGSTIFFLILNGFQKVIEEREAAADFDRSSMDLQTMMLLSFRKALAVSLDKELFVKTLIPRCAGGYGLLGNTYIYDPDSCAYYRDTDLAKETLCDFYSVDAAGYSSLDAAVESITGYDPVMASRLYQEAYEEALAAGYVTDADGDGLSDQSVVITYAVSADSDSVTKILDYLNEKIAEATAGSGFSGKVSFQKSAPLGNSWAEQFRNGLADLCLAGWSGSRLDPFSLTDLYVDPGRAYDANWFDASSVYMRLSVPVDAADPGGKRESLEMNLLEWSDALNGASVQKGGKEYNFGFGQADTETRLEILAAFEKQVLGSYDYIPIANDGGMNLLSQQAYYVVEDYNPVLGRGGLAYLRYNYDDQEWAAYVASQGGSLQY